MATHTHFEWLGRGDAARVSERFRNFPTSTFRNADIPGQPWFSHLSAVTNLASYASAPLAPNSLACMLGRLFHFRICIVKPTVNAASGWYFPVSLKDANGSVWPAGIIFASFRQINILVPATVAPGRPRLR